MSELVSSPGTTCKPYGARLSSVITRQLSGYTRPSPTGLSSVSKDRNIKAPLYAASGFLEYWLVNVPEQVVEVFRAPGPDGYAQRARYAVGETIALEAFPDVRVEVTRLF